MKMKEFSFSELIGPQKFLEFFLFQFSFTNDQSYRFNPKYNFSHLENTYRLPLEFRIHVRNDNREEASL